MDFLTLLMATQLTAATANVFYLPDTAKSYDGEVREISQFYESTKPEFSLSTNTFVGNDKLVSLQYNNGYNSSKLKIDPSLYVTTTKVIPLDYDWSLSLTGGVKLGGTRKDIPCTDSFNREYFCQNLTAFADHSVDNSLDYSVGIRATYSF